MSPRERIVFTNSEGGVSIIVPARSLAEAMKDVPPGASNVQVVDQSDIPTDRYYRNAWIKGINGKVVDVDPIQAKELHKEKLRQVRAPLMAQLDVEYQRADEQEDRTAKQTIIAKKQALRDVTAIVDSVDSVEQLRTTWPEKDLGPQPE